MKYQRVILITNHGFDGKKMELGAAIGSVTEYDQEASICAFLSMLFLDEKYRCEYVPKTKRQWEPPIQWKNDLVLEIRCSFASMKDKLSGSYVEHIAECFPTLSWHGTGKTILVLGKVTSLQPANTTAKDIFRKIVRLF